MNINLDQKVSIPLVDPRPLWHCNKDQLQWFVKLNTNDEAVLNKASSDAYRHIVDEVFEILQDFTDIQLAKACEDEIKNLYNIVINTSCHDDTTISGRIKFHLLQ